MGRRDSGYRRRSRGWRPAARAEAATEEAELAAGEPRKAPLRIYLERGDKRTFAGALDWPGWSRAGKDEAQAIESLLAYAPRCARVVKRSGLKESVPGKDAAVDIVQRLPGGGGTDFGCPVSRRRRTGSH